MGDMADYYTEDGLLPLPDGLDIDDMVPEWDEASRPLPPPPAPVHDWLADALQSLHTTMVFDPRDWGRDRRDSWRYAIIVGWPDEAMEEQAEKHHWSEADVARLQEMHRAVRARLA